MARGRSSFLLEVRCEEIPARMLGPATKELGTRVFEELMGRGIAPSKVETGFTPRRLVLEISGLPTREPDTDELLTGPPVSVAFDGDGQPTKAAEGFAKKCGVELDAVTRIETPKGEYLAVERRISGRPTGEVLSEVVPRVLGALAWPKTMRWGSGVGPWVRPVHGVVALFQGEVVPFELFGVAAGRTTCGHPTLSPEPFDVRGPADYHKKLGSKGVSTSFADRKDRLRETMASLAAAHGARVVPDEQLLDKLAAICEIPGVMDGELDPGYLQLPREVLIASLRDHQSAFTMEVDGELLPRFLTVMDRPDDPIGRVKSGNEWVVDARLADARFFHGEDRKVPLVERARQLTSLSFHDRLGSYADKSERLVSLAELICRELGWNDEVGLAREAAGLLKADLVTEMVREFTDLQGIMGGVYAREEGYPEPVALAIYEHYRPESVEQEVPRGRVGKACALADRIDTLVGIFGLGMVPTGSRDPFGLRRAAQGALRILLDGALSLDLELVAAHAARLYGELLSVETEELLTSLRGFLEDRIRYLLGRERFAYDEIEAAIASGSSDLPDLRARVSAIKAVRDDPDFLSIVLAAKRIANIVKDADEEELDPAVDQEPAEADLGRALSDLKTEVEEAMEERNYERTLRATASLAEVLDRFFVEVLVMAEDPAIRRNRIALLQEIQRTLCRTAVLTEIVVDKGDYRAS